MNTDSLKDKTVKGTFWSAIDNIANLGISFVVSIILARLLSPAEYGILAMIQIFIAISTTIVDSGFSNALIRKQDLKSIDYNTTFCFNIVLSIILYIVLFLSAPCISSFFHEPILIKVTRVIGLILIINALSIIPRTIFVRTINFKVQMKVSFTASVISGLIGITMAMMNFGVWSLIGQQLSRQILNTVLLWIASKWIPIFEFSIESFKYLFGYGSKLLLSGLLNTIWENVYYIVIGKFYSSAELGQYTRAQQFSGMFSNNLTSVIQRVCYPVLSCIQDKDERLKNIYQRMNKSTMLVTFALMLGMCAIAKPLIFVLIGKKWTIAVGYLQLLCFSGMLYPLHANNLNILQVKGRSDLFLKLEVLKKIIAIFPIYLGIFHGIIAMLIAMIVTSVMGLLINSYYTNILINYSIIQQLKDIFESFVISLVVSCIMFSITFIDIPFILMLIIQIIIGLILSIGIYEVRKSDGYVECKQILMSLINRNK